MKGKNLFNKKEIELIEALIIKRCNAESAQQKNIRSKMAQRGIRRECIEPPAASDCHCQGRRQGL